MERNINSKNYIENIEKAYFPNESPLPNSIPSISGFVGREDCLADLRESYQKGSRCFVLHGTGGVGKSALTLQFAGEIAKDFEAKIFVEMNGMSEHPLSVKDAMFDIVRQFEREISADTPDAQLKSLFVQFVQNQPTLIVLDNAASKEAVESLKDAKACFITTSREAFDLTGGESRKISQMSPEDARKLLFNNGGGEQRFDGRVDELAELAGYLPMALKPLASILREDELETAADLIERYRDKKELLKERVPDYGNLTIEASFELSYEALSDEMKARWRRLSVFPADFDQAAIAAILDVSTDKAKATQKRLRRFSLIEVNLENKRFNLHDLVRTFANGKLSEDERFQIQFLFARYYASVLLSAQNMQLNEEQNYFVNALRIIDTEWENITAGQRWSAEFTEKDDIIAELNTDYSGFASDFLNLRLHPRIFISWMESGWKAARKINNRQLEGNNLANLGIAHEKLSEYWEAIKYYEQALEIFREIRDISGIKNSLGNLGNPYERLGDYEKAIYYHKQSLELSIEMNDLSGKCKSLANLGLDYYKLDKYEEAAEFYELSLPISQALGDRKVEAAILTGLGNINKMWGKYETAIEYHKESLDIKKEIGNRFGEGISLGNIGACYEKSGKHQKAIDYQNQSLEISREIGNLSGEASCLRDLGSAYYNSGDKENGCNSFKKALAIFETIKSPDANEVREIIDKFCIG